MFDIKTKEKLYITDYMEEKLKEKLGFINQHDKVVIVKVIEVFNTLCNYCRESDNNCHCWDDS